MKQGLKNIRMLGGGTNLYHESDGFYHTQVLDSKLIGNVWHRMSIKAYRGRGALYKVSIYTSDDNMLIYKNRIKSINDVLNMEAGEEKDGFLSAVLVKAYKNPTDILLHDTKGRFLWCRIEIPNNKGVEFDFITVSTPAQTLLSYLPELYQEDLSSSFADKYLSIFQTMYEDFENEISHSGALYEASSAPIEFVEQMAEWFAIEDMHLWSPNQLRLVLQNIHRLYKYRGTLKALELIIEIFCQNKAYFVETYHAMRYYKTHKDLEALYLSDRFSLWVMIFQPMNEKTKNILLKLLEKSKPLHIKINLIILKPMTILSYYTYVGINSVVSDYQNAGIDGQAKLGYNRLCY